MRKREWKAISDRLQKIRDLSRVVDDMKIRSRKKRQMSENIPL
jgi:hypothetical protein